MSKETNVEPVLISVKELALMLGVCTRQIWRMLGRGLIPAGIRLGGSQKFNKSVIEDWITKGCPDRQTFENRAA